jgi:hypothetical protein
MHKYVHTVLLGDEPVALGFVEPLNLAFLHTAFSSWIKKN